MRPILPSERDRKRRAFQTSRPHVLVEIWRDPDDADQNADRGGFIVTSGEEGKRKIEEMPCRFWPTERTDAEQNFGDETVSATTWTFRFNEGFAPDVRFTDELHFEGRIFQVINPGGVNSSAIQRDVIAMEIIEGETDNGSI